jgi:hypothetical protein
LYEYDRILFYEKELIEKAIGSNHRLFLENMKRKDPLKIVTALYAIAEELRE